MPLASEKRSGARAPAVTGKDRGGRLDDSDCTSAGSREPDARVAGRFRERASDGRSAPESSDGSPPPPPSPLLPRQALAEGFRPVEDPKLAHGDRAAAAWTPVATEAEAVGAWWAQGLSGRVDDAEAAAAAAVATVARPRRWPNSNEGRCADSEPLSVPEPPPASPRVPIVHSEPRTTPGGNGKVGVRVLRTRRRSPVPVAGWSCSRKRQNLSYEIVPSSLESSRSARWRISWGASASPMRARPSRKSESEMRPECARSSARNVSRTVSPNRCWARNWERRLEASVFRLRSSVGRARFEVGGSYRLIPLAVAAPDTKCRLFGNGAEPYGFVRCDPGRGADPDCRRQGERARRRR